MKYTSKQITGATLITLGVGYLLMQLAVFFIKTSTYMGG